MSLEKIIQAIITMIIIYYRERIQIKHQPKEEAQRTNEISGYVEYRTFFLVFHEIISKIHNVTFYFMEQNSFWGGGDKPIPT
jgi:hypothetical protein